VRCEGQAGRLDLLDATAPPPVWCVADFAGPVRRAVTAWKDQGRTDMRRWFAAALSAAVADVAVRDTLARLAGSDGLLVVGVPTSPAAVRRRGRDMVGDLVRAVVRGADGSLPLRAAPVLRRVGGVDSAGLGARARAQHLHEAVRVRRCWPEPRSSAPWVGTAAQLRGAQVVLVDDVLTTGATFAACRRALGGAGADVVAGIVLASTPGPGRSDVGRHGVEVEGRGVTGLA